MRHPTQVDDATAAVAVEYAPAAQAPHWLVIAEDAKRPAAHGWHALWPARAAKAPRGQTTQIAGDDAELALP